MSTWQKRSGGWLLVVGCLLAASGCGRQHPNLVVVTFDTTRVDHIGAFGYDKARTPTVDALADGGFLFRNHLTPVPLTLPAHTSLFTGHTPPVHTVRDNGTFYVPEGETTLAEVLADAGYDTSAFVGSFPLARQFQLDQGFGHYDDDFRHDRFSDPRRAGLDIFFDERPAGAVVDAALAYHRERKAKPFFTFLHFFDPHQPQEPPPPFDLEFRARPYDGEIAYADSELARFFALLKERGEWDNTIVVFTADHGEGLGEHGELTHAILLHQATLHVPLILRGPGVTAGETTEWTRSTQLYATLLELLGIDLPKLEHPVDDSLLPLIENGGARPADAPRFTAYFETIAPRTVQGWAQLTGWMKEDWRLVYGPKPELYQLREDPQELDNRFAAEGQIGDRLETELREYLRDHEVGKIGDAVQTADEETLRRLAALGYLQLDAGALSNLSSMMAIEGMVNPRDRVVDVSLFSSAKSAMAAGQWNRAFSLHRELLNRSPDNVQALRGIATLYGVIGDWDSCFKNLDRALELEPGNQDIVIHRGQLLIQAGRRQEGLDVLLAIEPQRRTFNSIFWTAQALRDLGRYDEALEWFEMALAKEPKNPWALLNLANHLATGGDLDRAEELLRALIADNPYFSLAYYNYGKLLLDRGDREGALGLFERSNELQPEHEPTRAALHELGAPGF
jgi:arylsulfatase A-like enzyme/Tfp pilus assembly protein PilF